MGFVAKKASAANLGERKRKAVERMGMGEEWVDDEAEDEARAEAEEALFGGGEFLPGVGSMSALDG